MITNTFSKRKPIYDSVSTYGSVSKSQTYYSSPIVCIFSCIKKFKVGRLAISDNFWTQ